MTRPRSLPLDFAVPVRRSTAAGVLLCLAGIAAATAVGVEFRSAIVERARLDDAIDAIADQRRAPVDTAGRAAAETEFAKMSRELAIPWTKLLTELEAASNDMASQVSLLHVEPDAEKHLVRITAEVRSLPDALAYLQRLQRSPVLRYPMLESHERRKDDPEHAVRIKVAAEWRS
jgi:hypothetical protein